MKIVLLMAFVCMVSTSCDTPSQVTGNPGNQAATSGTVGSAKMTNELPAKSDTSIIQRDSIRQNR